MQPLNTEKYAIIVTKQADKNRKKTAGNNSGSHTKRLLTHDM